MRRSRRCLGLLLAVLAASLVIVRVTTEPAVELDGPEMAGAEPGQRRQQFGIWTAEFGVSDFRLPKSELSTHRNQGLPQPPTSSPAVSAVAVIVVLPKRPADKAVQVWTGWSGCSAYACGCDHLGSPLRAAAFASRRVGDRLLLGSVNQLVGSATRFSQWAATVLAGRSAMNQWSELFAGDLQHPPKPAARPPVNPLRTTF